MKYHLIYTSERKEVLYISNDDDLEVLIKGLFLEGVWVPKRAVKVVLVDDGNNEIFTVSTKYLAIKPSKCYVLKSAYSGEYYLGVDADTCEHVWVEAICDAAWYDKKVCSMKAVVLIKMCGRAVSIVEVGEINEV